jgi:hypothetical protein
VNKNRQIITGYKAVHKPEPTCIELICLVFGCHPRSSNICEKNSYGEIRLLFFVDVSIPLHAGPEEITTNTFAG